MSIGLLHDDHDDDNCQFVEHPNIRGKALLVVNTGAVSLPDDRQRKTQTENKMRKWMMVQSLVWGKKKSLEFTVKS